MGEISTLGRYIRPWTFMLKGHSTMTVIFNYYVTQGTYGITNKDNLTFGTGGLATCVGIIAELDTEDLFCGHMDSDVDPKNPDEKIRFKAKVEELLLSTLPIDNVQSIYYCSSGAFASTICIKEKILEMFPNATNKGDLNTNLYVNLSGVVANNQDYNNGSTQVNNGPFTITSL